MKIAVLGWGSLICDPRNLQIKGDWKPDGPLLPIEFARVSKGKRLTLVLHPVANNVQTLWALSACEDLNDAIKNLSKRECTKPRFIGCISFKDDEIQCRTEPQIQESIRQWAKQKGLDAVIWTNLRANFEERTQMDFIGANVITYLRRLKGRELEEAEKYFRRAPKQVTTRIRSLIEKELGWVKK